MWTMCMFPDVVSDICHPTTSLFKSCEISQFRVIRTFQVRIQDLVKGGATASEAESCPHGGAESCELSAAGVQDPLKGPGRF